MLLGSQYFNDTQSINVELLSHQYRNYTLDKSAPSAPMNFVLHTPETEAAGEQTPNSSTYAVPVLPLDLSGSFHEYRFDWMPDRVSFFVDGTWIWDLNDTQGVPSTPSPLLLNHWSNGSPGWTLGPPVEDAVSTVAYVRAYFNSSDNQHVQASATNCASAPKGASSMCQVSDPKTSRVARTVASRAASNKGSETVEGPSMSCLAMLAMLGSFLAW